MGIFKKFLIFFEILAISANEIALPENEEVLQTDTATNGDQENEVCDLPAERGPCNDTVTDRYYYSATNHTCLLFQYGGCEGNGNNFEYQDECMAACHAHRGSVPALLGRLSNFTATLAAIDIAELLNTTEQNNSGIVQSLFSILSVFEQDGLGLDACFLICNLPNVTNLFSLKEDCETTCRGFDPCSDQKYLNSTSPTETTTSIRYKYSPDINRCISTEAEVNQYFKTKEDCEKTCHRKQTMNIPSKEEICALPKDVGPCKASHDRFYYSPENMECQMFTYGGCKGNFNNFKTKEKCETLCLPRNTTVTTESSTGDSCEEPKQEGDCAGFVPRFYYSAETKECTSFVYGGCGGNGNNFETLSDCEAACKRES